MFDNHYLKGFNLYLIIQPMGNLKTNFDNILPIVKKTMGDQLNEADKAYPNPPNLPDAHIITLSLLQEALSIDSEHFFGVDSKAVTKRIFRAGHI